MLFPDTLTSLAVSGAFGTAPFVPIWLVSRFPPAHGPAPSPPCRKRPGPSLAGMCIPAPCSHCQARSPTYIHRPTWASPSYPARPGSSPHSTGKLPSYPARPDSSPHSTGKLPWLLPTCCALAQTPRDCQSPRDFTTAGERLPQFSAKSPCSVSPTGSPSPAWRSS